MSDRLFLLRPPEFLKTIEYKMKYDISRDYLNIERKWFYYFARKCGLCFTPYGAVIRAVPDYGDGPVYIPDQGQLDGDVIAEIVTPNGRCFLRNKNKRIYEASKINLSSIYGSMGRDIMNDIKSMI